MPIIGRTPEACGKEFRNHLAKLIAQTLTRTDPVRLLVAGTAVQVSFPEGAIPLKTKFGRIYFYLAQALEAVEEDGRYRLRTMEYWYRLQTSDSSTEKALIRWEYTRQDEAHDTHPRHHAHASASLALPTAEVSLNDVHLPTGWVTIEEMIRFAITELGVKPPCGVKWPQVLKASEEKFYEKFTGKRHKRAAATS